MKEVRGAVFAGSSPPFLGRERAAVDVDVGPERRSPRYHETCLDDELSVRLHTREGTVRSLFKISRCTVPTDCSNAEQDRTQDNKWAA